jgi:hypothetical protein
LKSIDTPSLSTAMAVQPFLFALMLRGKELTRRNTSAVRQQPTQSTCNKIFGITSTPARRRTPIKVKPPPIVSSRFRFFARQFTADNATKIISVFQNVSSVVFRIAGLSRGSIGHHR